MEEKPKSRSSEWLSPLTRNILAITLVGVIAYKIIFTPFELNIDFLALLSLVLALFSVWLSALFYFKATETSNAFYDNSFKYSQEIVELLVRIESGFGVQLKNLDVNYSRMHDKIYERSSPDAEVRAKEDLKEDEKKLKKLLDERNLIITNLVARTDLADKDKKKMIEQLEAREQELTNAREALIMLENELKSLQSVDAESEGFNVVYSRVRGYLGHKFVRIFGKTGIRSKSMATVRNKWTTAVNQFLPTALLQDMRSLKFVNSENELTKDGLDLMLELSDESQ